MLNNQSFIALLLDSPMQSWGTSSRFERRSTGLYPSKSAVIGMIAAAMGIDKNDPSEPAQIAILAEINIEMISIPKQHPMERIEDFHTVEGTIRANGSRNENCVISKREYLVDARFGIILHGEKGLLDKVAAALQNPIWGIWMGRKCCIAALPVFVIHVADKVLAWNELLKRLGISENLQLDSFARLEEVNNFSDGTDSIRDVPTTYSRPDACKLRRIRIVPKK